MLRFRYRVLKEPPHGWHHGLEEELNRLGAEGYQFKALIGGYQPILEKVEDDEEHAAPAEDPNAPLPLGAPAASTDLADTLCGCGCREIVSVPLEQWKRAKAVDPGACAWAPGHFDPGIRSVVIASKPPRTK